MVGLRIRRVARSHSPAPPRSHRFPRSHGSHRAITNDEPFTGAEGREFHIRDPDAREASAADGLDKGLDGDRTDADRADGGSPLREDKHSFASFNDFDDEPETTPGIIAAAREFAGDPDWDDWELASPRPTEGMEGYQAPSAALPDPTLDRLETGLEMERMGGPEGMDPQPSGVVAFNPAHQHSQYDV